MRGNGKTNAFGQTLLRSDYGADNLWRYRDEALDLGASVASGTLVGSTTTLLVAEIDPDAPAKEHRYDRLREPDFCEDGYAHWIGTEGVVSVGLESTAGFRSWVRCRGMSPLARTLDVTLTPFAENASPTSLWAEVEATCVA